VHVVQTKDAEFDPPTPEGDYSMDPISAPSGQAWILHEILDEPGHNVPAEEGVVWWSTGNGRELVVVSGQGFSDAELIATLPQLEVVRGTWAWSGAATAGLPEVPYEQQPAPSVRAAQTILPDGQRATIVVQTGTRWDLLQQATIYSGVLTGRPRRRRRTVARRSSVPIPATTTCSGSRAMPSCT
jgi:hypothetical protein